MKAVTVVPGNKKDIEVRKISKPKIDDIEDGRGVLVKVLQVAMDSTDLDIYEGSYGEAPEGEDYLVIGHEVMGIVEEVGENVNELSKGDYVTAIVRRPGDSIYDELGWWDFTTDEEYHEHGISKLQGYLREYFVEKPDFLIKIPATLKDVGVLTEPVSIIEKGIEQALAIQKRLPIWEPKKAAVLGTGPIGLLAALKFRLMGLEVFAFAKTPPPVKQSELIEEIGGKYFNTDDLSVEEAEKKYGEWDIIVEATGADFMVPIAANALGKNGVLILTSITPPEDADKVDVNMAKINQFFVLHNKVMFGTVNSNRKHFEDSIELMAHAEAVYPGWLKKLITHTVNSLEDYKEVIDTMENEDEAIKVVFKIEKE